MSNWSGCSAGDFLVSHHQPGVGLGGEVLEQLTSFVSSRGILRSCDFHNRRPLSSSSQLDPDLISRPLQRGEAIYVCTDALGEFVDRILPGLDQPFYLVSGDSDLVVDAHFLASAPLTRLVADDRLMGWRAQNLQVEHLRLQPIPIGLDYHTVHERPGMWELSPASPIAQEHQALSILAGSPRFGERYLAAYCNWRNSAERGDRQECMARIEPSACLFETAPLPRHATWRRQSEFMFVASPEGYGTDCHRTWEALLLGCIPIVRRRTYTAMMAELPAMIIDDWGQVTKTELADQAKAFSERRFDFTPLFLHYWARLLRGREPMLLPPMTMAEFRMFLTRGGA